MAALPAEITTTDGTMPQMHGAAAQTGRVGKGSRESPICTGRKSRRALASQALAAWPPRDLRFAQTQYPGSAFAHPASVRRIARYDINRHPDVLSCKNVSSPPKSKKSPPATRGLP
jgi:hypothetical protein